MNINTPTEYDALFQHLANREKRGCCNDKASTPTPKQQKADISREYNLAGFTRDQVNVTLDSNVLSIVADSKKYGRHFDEFSIPYPVSDKNISVNLSNGILHVNIKCPDEDKPRVITVL